jgi:hypothetical protein
MVSYFESVRVEPFTIAVDDAVLDDLGERIGRTRWPGLVAGAGWDAGMDADYLRDLLATWAGDFDWRARERALNTFAQFRARANWPSVTSRWPGGPRCPAAATSPPWKSHGCSLRTSARSSVRSGRAGLRPGGPGTRLSRSVPTVRR